MKIIIAGATGFIGRDLINALLKDHHSIIALTRKPRSSGTDPHPLLEHVEWDGKTVGSWTRHVDGADAVVNLCGESLGSGRWSAKRKHLLRSSRIDPTNALVESIRRASVKPPVLLNASAVGYYGDTGDVPVSEDRGPSDDYLGKLCVDWESAALRSQGLGVRVVLLRSGVVLDPNHGALQRLLLPFRMFVGGALGSGKQWFPWIHRDDEIAAILFALNQKDLSGPINLVAPQPITMKELSTELGKVLKRPSFFSVPSFVLKSLLGEMASVVLTGQRIEPAKILEAGFQFRFPNIREALIDLLRKG